MKKTIDHSDTFNGVGESPSSNEEGQPISESSQRDSDWFDAIDGLDRANHETAEQYDTIAPFCHGQRMDLLTCDNENVNAAHWECRSCGQQKEFCDA